MLALLNLFDLPVLVYSVTRFHGMLWHATMCDIRRAACRGALHDVFSMVDVAIVIRLFNMIICCLSLFMKVVELMRIDVSKFAFVLMMDFD